MAVVRVAPVPLLRGTVQVPPDKSLTHRVLLLAAIGDREVTITRPLDSEDTGATLGLVEACRVPVSGDLGHQVRVSGRGGSRHRPGSRGRRTGR